MMAVAITIAALYTSPYGSHDFDQRPSTSSSPTKNGHDQFHQSPVSVINGPVTWTTTSSRRFKGFVTHVFGTCVNSSSRLNENDNYDDELMFSMDDENEEGFVKEMLLDAQLKYNVFNDDLVVQAFFEAAKAHKGQVVYLYYICF